MVDLDPIPLADDDRTTTTATAAAQVPLPAVSARGKVLARARGSVRGPLLPLGLIVLLAAAHGMAIWTGLGGRKGLNNGWPIWRDDHSLYYHSALVTRAFLRQSGTTAGYDPFFMAGYPKSVVFPASSTLPELVVWAFGGDHPEFAYKLYVLISAAAVPWLVAFAAWSWRIGAHAAAIAVLLFLIYLWTDFPINYAAFGMLPYLLVVPLALVATGIFAGYLRRGGLGRWLAAAVLMSLSLLVHLTAAMIVAPAAALAYLAAASSTGGPSASGEIPARRGLPAGRHLGVWLVPVVVLAANAFWWLPGLWLASTKGASDFVLAHSSEPVIGRLLQIVTVEAEVQSILIGAGFVGLLLLARSDRIGVAALGGFALAGFSWGYLAAFFPGLDFLQPGRHTYAFYTALAVASGAGVHGLLLRLQGGGATVRFDRWAMAAAMLVGLRVLGPPLQGSVRARLWASEPFLSSRPSTRLLWVVERVKAHVKPGERLLYEEGGKDIPGVPDPFQRGRFSGLLPERTGVELLGGPYLHAALTTNFTQFGENRLFGSSDWDRDYFVRYARLYRPAAILCWSPHARAFCRSNPDLITILDDEGTLLIGRVKGFEGDTIVGEAKVESEAGRLRVREMVPGVDGSIVLRYHSVPSLWARPSMPIEPRLEEGDPVPFIGLRPSPGIEEVELEIAVPFQALRDGSRSRPRR